MSEYRFENGNSVNNKGESVITETVIGVFELTTESETPVEKAVSESYDISMLHDDRIIVRAMYVNEGSGITSILPDFNIKFQHLVISRLHGKQD